MEEKKVLIVGDIIGHFRSQLFIQTFLHTDMGSKTKVIITSCNPRIYKILINKKVGYFLNILLFPFFLIELFVKMAFCDIIYLLAMNHNVAAKVFLFNKVLKKKVISDLYISIYDAKNDRLLFNKSFLRKIKNFQFEGYYKYLDRTIIENSDALIYVGNTELKFISQLVGAKLKNNIHIIPPASLTKKIATPTVSEVYRICWWGTFIPFHGVDVILETIKILYTRTKKISVDLFGTPNHDYSKYSKICNELGLSEVVTFHSDKTFGNGKLEEYLETKCDLALGNFGTTERAERAMPTKIIDALSMQIPVLTMETEVLKENFDLLNEVFTCSNDPHDTCENILQIMNNSPEAKRRARLGYIKYKNNFSEDVIKRKFVDVVKLYL